MPGKPRKLTQPLVDEMRHQMENYKALGLKIPFSKLAEQYGVHRATIYKIWRNQIWAGTEIPLMSTGPRRKRTAI